MHTRFRCLNYNINASIPGWKTFERIIDKHAKIICSCNTIFYVNARYQKLKTWIEELEMHKNLQRKKKQSIKHIETFTCANKNASISMPVDEVIL